MVTPELLSYIHGELAKGRTKQEIYAELMGGGGWMEQDIQEAFSQIEPPTSSDVTATASPTLFNSYPGVQKTNETKMGKGTAIFFCFMLAILPSLVLLALLGDALKLHPSLQLFLISFAVMIFLLTWLIYFIRSLIIKHTKITETPNLNVTLKTIVTYTLQPNPVDDASVSMFKKEAIRGVVVSQIIAAVIFIIGAFSQNVFILIVALVLMSESLDYFTTSLYLKINGIQRTYVQWRFLTSRFTTAKNTYTISFFGRMISLLEGYAYLLIFGVTTILTVPILGWVIFLFVAIAVNWFIYFLINTSLKTRFSLKYATPLLIHLVVSIAWVILIFILAKSDPFFVGFVKSSWHRFATWYLSHSQHNPNIYRG